MAFCFLEFFIFYIILFKEYRKEPLYIISFISLLFIPWYKTGFWNFFVMRVSIPALIILMLYVLRYFIKNGFKSKQDLRWLCMAIIIVIGAITPSQEIINSINFTLFKSSNAPTYDLKTLSTIDRTKLFALDSYVIIDPEKSYFFKNFARMK
jgi:hypothetical protein